MSQPISPDALRAQLEADAPTVVDVRSPDEYAQGHLPGAINIPVDELEARLDEIPQDRPVVPYCNMYHPGTSRGERATDLLRARGFEASTLQGGFPAWLKLDAAPSPEEREGE